MVVDSRIDEDNTHFRLNGESFPYYKSYRTDQVFDLASGTANQSVEFSFELLEEMLTIRDLNLYRFNLTQFNSLMNEMANRQMVIDSFSQTKIDGRITVTDNTDIFMLSIPYSEGWTIEIDGKAVDTFPVLDGLLATDITSGEHRITLSYRTPYLTIGIFTSLFSACILYLIDKKKRQDH